jgi:hypothetical protein
MNVNYFVNTFMKKIGSSSVLKMLIDITKRITNNDYFSTKSKISKKVKLKKAKFMRPLDLVEKLSIPL